MTLNMPGRMAKVLDIQNNAAETPKNGNTLRSEGK